MRPSPPRRGTRPRWRSQVPIAAAVLAFVAALAACSGTDAPAPAAGDDDGGPLLVLAASDLQTALAEVAAHYAAAGGRPPELVFGSTGNLATQIVNGAPADLFFAANDAFMDRLEAADLVAPGTRRVYAVGRLAVVWETSAPAPWSLAELVRPEYAVISLANPEHAPYGIAAREALESAGIWARVQPRVVFGENVSQALQYVRTGNASAGLVALGLIPPGGAAPHLVVPAELHGPLRQVAAVVRTSPRQGEAARFLALVMAPEGQAILRRYGFEPPPP